MKRRHFLSSIGIIAAMTTSSFCLIANEGNNDYYTVDLEEDEFLFSALYDENDNIEGEFREENIEEELQKAETLVEKKKEEEPIVWVRKPEPVVMKPDNGLKLLPLNDLIYSRKKAAASPMQEVAVQTKTVYSNPKVLLKPKRGALEKQPPAGLSEEIPFKEESLNRQSRNRVFTDFSLVDELPESVAQDEVLAQNEPTFAPLPNRAPTLPTQTPPAANPFENAMPTPPAEEPATPPTEASAPSNVWTPSVWDRPVDRERQDKAQPPPQGAETPTARPITMPPAQAAEKPAQPLTPKEEVIEETPKEPNEPETYLIKFNNIKMTDYLNSVSRITGKNFTFDPADLDFNVSIISNEPMTLENIIAALLQELRIRGLSMVEVGNNLLIHKQTAVSSPASVYKSGETLPLTADIVTQVYKLQNANPQTIANIIRPMLSANAVIEALPDSGHLIVTGLRSNILRITDLINSIDSPEASLDVGEYQALNMPISEAIVIAEEILRPIAKDRPLVLTPYSSRNVVYIVTTPTLLKQALLVFQKIDLGDELAPSRFDAQGNPILGPDGKPLRDGQQQGQGPGGQDGSSGGLQGGRLTGQGRFQPQQPLGSIEATKFYIHKLQYRQGDQIADALRQVGQSLEGLQGSESNWDLIYTINSSQWIEGSNSLIFTGTPKTLELVKELIDELDTALPQVLIEILVLEASVEDSLEFDVDWGTRFGDVNSAGAQAFLSTDSPLVSALNSTLPGRSIDGTRLATQSGFNLGIIGRSVSRDNTIFNSMGALVRALHTDQRIDVLLNPKIVVEDNATAEFFVGLNVPFQTESIANEFGNIVTSNYEFRDIGSTIKVTPLIGNNGIITLDIEQEISSIVANNVILPGGQVVTTNLGGGVISDLAVNTGTDESIQNIGPTTRKSNTKTRIHLPDGYFLIISGQIREEKRETKQQVPCLGGIPWIGALFSDKSNFIDKKNLMLFIRPQIVDVERINPITKRQQDIWKERHRMPKFWEYEVDQALDWFNVYDSFCDPEEAPLME